MTPLANPALSGTVTAARQPSANDGLRKQAQDLEGVFLNTLVSQMMSSIKTDGAFGGGYAEDTWRSIQSEQIANSIAHAGGIGLADDIMHSLLLNQQAVNSPQNQAD